MPDALKRAHLPALDAGPREISQIKRAITADLEPFDAMHVLACIAATEMFSRPDIYTELDADSAATIEYVASILLERGTPDPIGSPGDDVAMSRAIQQTLDRTRGITMQAIFSAREREKSAQDPIEAIAATVEVHDAISRWPGYAQQAESLLAHLGQDDEIASCLQSVLGFDIAQALELEDAVGRLLTRRMNAHGERTASLANEVHESIARSADGSATDAALVDARLAFARGMRLIADEHFSVKLRDALLVTPTDLAEEAGMDQSLAEAFLDCFASRFGDTKGTNLMTGRNQVRRRPFVSDGTGRYLLTLPGNLLWELRPRIEEALKRTPPMFHRYEATRSRYVETTAAAHVAKALKTDQVWTNACYWLDGIRYEADVIAVIDDLCVIVEAKAGAMAGTSWRGRKADLSRDLQDLLGKSSEQCARLAAELDGGLSPSFFDRNTNEPIAIPVAAATRVESVVVTLEGLGFVGLVFPKLREAGLLGDGEPPWVVSLYDLGAVADNSTYAPQFTSFIRRRRTLDERVEFLDECDLWMMHLRETLDFSSIRGQAILVEGRSDPLHRTWMFGARPPTMKLDKAAKRRLRELDRKRPSGFLSAGEQVVAEAQRGRRPNVQAF
ncbi:hypothetical protein GKE82_04775 [Conexibacter sp. W3-3-2]|uniref:hypothetical protein n=1 Tax=Conexibacter sp. W3-3-2 TaxID=2675227 RepID=UPI0012B7FD3A|nr:hypothetical protein [Conexibacter sp. W3-3-2]MTD43635.1 hypothetical protein [Conexibacter sp. W3-3-2]